MKKLSFVAAIMCGLAVTSCQKSEAVTSMPQTEEVTITFGMPYEQQAMTRAAKSIAEVVTRLDVWIVDGTDTIKVNQTSATQGFGTVQATLDNRKTYKVIAVGHKADGPATIADGIISWPDDKVIHTLYYTGEISPAETTNLSAEMTRIVAAFVITTTDAVPTEAKKMRFTLSDVWNRWSIAAGATNKLDRTAEVSISSTKPDGTASFIVYAICTDAETTHTVTVQALDASDGVVQSRTFSGVTLRNGYKTTYRGKFFIDEDVSAGFTIAEWNEYDVVDF